MDWTPLDWVSILLAAAIPVALIMSGIERWTAPQIRDKKAVLDGRGRVVRGRGYGWQAIRYVAVATTTPLVGLLAVRGLLDRNAYAFVAAVLSAVFGGALGYSAAKKSSAESD